MGFTGSVCLACLDKQGNIYIILNALAAHLVLDLGLEVFFGFFFVSVRDYSLLDLEGPHNLPNLSPLDTDLTWMIFLRVSGSRTECSTALSPLNTLSFSFPVKVSEFMGYKASFGKIILVDI